MERYTLFVCAMLVGLVTIVPCGGTNIREAVTKPSTSDYLNMDIVLKLAEKVDLQSGLIETLTTRIELQACDHERENEHMRKRIEYLESLEKESRKESTAMRAQLRKQQGVVGKLVKLIRDGVSRPSSESVDDHKATSDNIATLQHDLPNVPVTSNQSVSADETRIQSMGMGSYHMSSQKRIRRQTYAETNVAFFASLAGYLHHQGKDQPIVFDTIITNVGDAYNVHVGDFRAPVSGTYVISVTLMSYGNENAHFHWAKNGNALTQIILYSINNIYATSSQTIVLELEAGDNITIRNADTDASLHGGEYCMFSGFLLREVVDGGSIVG